MTDRVYLSGIYNHKSAPWTVYRPMVFPKNGQQLPSKTIFFSVISRKNKSLSTLNSVNTFLTQFSLKARQMANNWVKSTERAKSRILNFELKQRAIFVQAIDFERVVCKCQEPFLRLRWKAIGKLRFRFNSIFP